MSLRDVCGGRVSVFLGPFRNPFSRLLSDESGKGALFAVQKLFWVLSVVGSQWSVVTIHSRHSIENQTPWARYSNSRGCANVSLYATNHGHRLLVQSFLSHFRVKCSGNDFDASGVREFAHQPAPTCPAKGGKRVNARARERRDMRVPSKDSKWS